MPKLFTKNKLLFIAVILSFLLGPYAFFNILGSKVVGASVLAVVALLISWIASYKFLGVLLDRNTIKKPVFFTDDEEN